MVTIRAPWPAREATIRKVWPAGDRPGPFGTAYAHWKLSAGAAEPPAAGRVEGLVEDLRWPRLADRGQVDRAVCAGWMVWLMWKMLPGS